MIERRHLEETGGKRESILSKEFVEEVLSIAQDNLIRDGALKPVLFLQYEFDERVVFPLELPDTTEEKQIYFAAIGVAIRKSGKKIYEAMQITETWYVANEENLLEISPSEHPNRKEAISVFGRDRQGKLATILLQPFSRDIHNQPIFEPIEIEQYNVPINTGIHPVGLLDYLFLPHRSRRRKRRFQ